MRDPLPTDSAPPAATPESSLLAVTRHLCLLICVLSLFLVGGRIAVVRSDTGDVPFLSANDRSRWATVASLVDYRTYAIDRLQTRRDPETRRRAWQSIDRVQHRDSRGEIHDYSSKPPLLATMVAALYAVLKSVTGLSIQQSPMAVGRTLLAMVNLPMLALMLGCLTSLILRYCRSPWSAVALTTAAGFGTLMTPFAISLNNHLPAAAAVAVGLWLLDSQSRTGASWWKMFAAGLAVAMAVANELPALAIAPLWTLVALRIGWRRTLTGFVPGMAVVAVAFFGTNWIAHHSMRPPYAHRGHGELIAHVPTAAILPSTDSTLPAAQLQAIAQAVGVPELELRVVPSRTPGRWRIDGSRKTYAADLTPTGIAVHVWDDWYDYPGTYWTHEGRTGVDRGEESRVRYAFHVILGHHGVLSLTPIWLLSLAGAWMGLVRGGRKMAVLGFRGHDPDHPAFPNYPFWTIGVISLVTIVCLAFYLARPLIDRNYGGVSVGFRWLLWLAPLWIFLAIPAMDWLSRQRWGRVLAAILLGLSVFSVSASLDSPWKHPWIYRAMDDLGWIASGPNG